MRISAPLTMLEWHWMLVRHSVAIDSANESIRNERSKRKSKINYDLDLSQESGDDDRSPYLSQVSQKETVTIGDETLFLGTGQLEHSVA